MTRLLGWLRQGDRYLFEEIIRGKIVQHEVEALNSAERVGVYPKYADQVTTSLQHAARYQTALQVLREIEQLEGLSISQPTLPPISTHVQQP